MRNNITRHLDKYLSETCLVIANRHNLWTEVNPSRFPHKYLIYFPGCCRGEVITNQDNIITDIILYPVKENVIYCYTKNNEQLTMELCAEFLGTEFQEEE